MCISYPSVSVKNTVTYILAQTFKISTNSMSNILGLILTHVLLLPLEEGTISVRKFARFHNVGTLTLTDWTYLLDHRVSLHRFKDSLNLIVLSKIVVV